AGGREAEENVGAWNDLGERARARLARENRLPAVHQFLTAFVDDALNIANHDVLALGAERDEQIEGGQRRRAGTRANDFDFVDPLSGEFERVDDRRGNDDRGAVLIIVEHWNAHPGFRLLLDLETLRTLNVLEIDAAERRLERDNDVDELLNVR